MGASPASGPNAVAGPSSAPAKQPPRQLPRLERPTGSPLPRRSHLNLRNPAGVNIMLVQRDKTIMSVSADRRFPNLAVTQSVDELEAILGCPLVIGGTTLSAAEKARIRGEPGFAVLAHYVVRLILEQDRGATAAEGAAIIEEFRREREKAPDHVEKTRPLIKTNRQVSQGRVYYYTKVTYADRELSFRQVDEGTENDIGRRLFDELTAQVDNDDNPDSQAIWRRVSARYQPSVLELADKFLAGEQTGIPTYKAVQSRIRAHQCPAPGFATADTDLFYCWRVGAAFPALRALFERPDLHHGKYEGLKATSMGSPFACRFHAAWLAVQSFMLGGWSHITSVAFTEVRHPATFLPPVKVDQLFDVDLATDMHVPLPLVGDEKTAAALVAYLLGAGPPPHPLYAVADDIVKPRPSDDDPFDLRSLLDDGYVRYLNLLCALQLRKPSVDKEVRFAVNEAGALYQHGVDNIKITTQHHNLSKFSRTPLVAELGEIAIFVHQTVRQIVGDEKADGMLAEIARILREHHADGETSFFSRRVEFGAARPAPDEIRRRTERARPSALPRSTGRIAVLTAEQLPPGPELANEAAEGQGEVGEGQDEVGEGHDEVGEGHDEVGEPISGAPELTSAAAAVGQLTSDERRAVIKVAAQLESEFGGTLPRTSSGFPNPLEASSETAFVSLAAALLDRSIESCDQQRPLPTSPPAIPVTPGEKWEALREYGSGHNSIATMVLVLCREWLRQAARPGFDGLRCPGTGLPLVFGDAGHPLAGSIGHSVHGIPMAHGYRTPAPRQLASDYHRPADNVSVESWTWNLWRGSNRCLRAALELNKLFGLAWMRSIHPEGPFSALALDSADLARIETLSVSWHPDVDPRIDINVLSRGEQNLFVRLTGWTPTASRRTT
ncbi:uncharacterized protein PFL1_03942 [Pseudozyma flocculosa PF-1]|uniref:Uncharacterized protein n=1 Tax=Pseudozyma flocculosa PF-1 TaxID=1277687 RepID=A0A061H860_9BASI|nr:uncharacterized protein PFL1_03942 [Pseudozyma flocculosa PF-1]EPQ28639.1 hypothetical protein PFL1_03942 [Pseudozyma flocculosa PF-1]